MLPEVCCTCKPVWEVSCDGTMGSLSRSVPQEWKLNPVIVCIPLLLLSSGVGVGVLGRATYSTGSNRKDENGYSSRIGWNGVELPSV